MSFRIQCLSLLGLSAVAFGSTITLHVPDQSYVGFSDQGLTVCAQGTSCAQHIGSHTTAQSSQSVTLPSTIEMTMDNTGHTYLNHAKTSESIQVTKGSKISISEGQVNVTTPQGKTYALTNGAGHMTIPVGSAMVAQSQGFHFYGSQFATSTTQTAKSTPSTRGYQVTQTAKSTPSVTIKSGTHHTT